jgi:hypothetical protein
LHTILPQIVEAVPQFQATQHCRAFHQNSLQQSQATSFFFSLEPKIDLRKSWTGRGVSVCMYIRVYVCVLIPSEGGGGSCCVLT